MEQHKMKRADKAAEDSEARNNQAKPSAPSTAPTYLFRFFCLFVCGC